MVIAVKGDEETFEVPGTRFAEVRWVAETGSTNADVLVAARDGAPEGLVIVADHQTAGRGRAGRTWTAPAEASLLCTVLLRPPAPLAPLVTFALAVAAAEAVEELARVEPGLKWPNDLVIEEGPATLKLAGILAEAEWPHTSSAAIGHREPRPDVRVTVAAGIGLNIDWPDPIPDELEGIATALNHLTGVVVGRRELLEAMLRHLELRYAQLLAGDTIGVLDAWRARSATLGQTVRVHTVSGELVGKAVDVTAGGHLIVDSVEGDRREIAVGDVVHLRRAD